MSPQLHNLFLALRPAPEVIEQIIAEVETLREKKLLSGSGILPKNYHITLHWLGAYPEAPNEVLARAKKAVENIKLPPIDFVLDHFMGFRNKGSSPLVLCASTHSQLQSLWRELRIALSYAGFEKFLESKFNPHLTVAYTDTILPKQDLTSPIICQVQEFVLIDSHIGKSRHVILDRWQLNGDASTPLKRDLFGGA
ncbi:2'-5' RNA ligase family protein [Pseudolysobacter antarcticus]|uniref:2'-5' RNA ligase family protein n=1 Tax=Pseudolysobacter antarcticus TaxID=2511995 RepID=UPI0013EBE861|nr:2'-5' RNA ligase family protein [Pseudolysobacter antarcticus]